MLGSWWVVLEVVVGRVVVAVDPGVGLSAAEVVVSWEADEQARAVSSAVVDQEQGRWEEAEANYRQALEIFLEFQDRHGAARTYHNLGRVAQEQERFEEAQANYRQALEIYRDTSDLRNASIVASSLGSVLVDRDRHAEAVEILLFAAVSWRQTSKTWSDQDLHMLHRERRTIGPPAFEAHVASHVPADLTDEFMTAIEQTQQP
jgi:tetratricopeptide (TPR) repeat protein